MDIGNKYIHAEPIGLIKGKPAYAIVNTKSDKDIACIGWYSPWKRYALITDTPVVFDVGCMKSLINFMELIKEEVE